MLVAVKTPLTEFRLEGTGIPEDFIDSIKKTFGEANVKLDEDESSINIDDWDELKEFKKTTTPGSNLQFFRKMNGMTQSQLACIAGCDKMMVSKMERNVIPISRKNALKFSRIFKVGVQNFIM